MMPDEKRQPLSTIRPRSSTQLLVILTACVYGCFFIWPELYNFLGLMHYGFWFLDSFALLASNDALAHGLDPHANNPLDVFGRPHVYSHWWLWLGSLGLTRAHNLWLGLSWAVSFLGLALFWLRPRNAGELGVFALVLCSPPLQLAVNRANNDLVVFILMLALVFCLTAAQRAWRWLGVLAIALAAGLKYYPAAAAMVLLAGRRRCEIVARMSLMLLALLLVGWSIRHDLARLDGLLPQPEGLYSFGASILLQMLDLAPRSIIWFALSAALIAAPLGWRCRWLVPATAQREYLGFIVGAVLLTACFWAQVNFAYRWVFAVLLVPWLWRVMHNAVAPKWICQLAKMTFALLLIALWFEAVVYVGSAEILVNYMPVDEAQRWLYRAYVFLQPLHWLLFLCLPVFLFHFLRQAVDVLFSREEDIKKLHGDLLE